MHKPRLEVRAPCSDAGSPGGVGVRLRILDPGPGADPPLGADMYLLERLVPES